MTTVDEVFALAMSLMDELDRDGEARNSDTEEYEHRTPLIMNSLLAEYMLLTGSDRFVRIESFDDDIIGVDDFYAIAVMPYGLAAKLLLDENPAPASFFHQRYEELRERWLATRPAEAGGEIVDLYGGIEYGQFSRW